MARNLFDEVDPLADAHQWDNGSAVGAWDVGIFDKGRVWRLDVVMFSNSDTIAHHVLIDPMNAAGGSLWGQFAIPAGAGYAGVPPVELLSAWLPSSLQFWLVGAGQPWNFQLVEAVNAGKLLSVIGHGGGF